MYMAFIREKEINGRRYLYLVKSIRDGESVRQKVLKYIGPVGDFSEEDLRKIKEGYGF